MPVPQTYGQNILFYRVESSYALSYDATNYQLIVKVGDNLTENRIQRSDNVNIIVLFQSTQL